MFFKQFGGSVTNDLKAQYQASSNWKNGSFQNLVDVQVVMPFTKFPGIIYKQLAGNKNKAPTNPLPIIPFDKSAFLTPSDKAKFIWYGHSAILLRIQGKNLLIDPMLGPDTTPIAPIQSKRFSTNTLALINDFPAIISNISAY